MGRILSARTLATAAERRMARPVAPSAVFGVRTAAFSGFRRNRRRGSFIYTSN
jgi:hypothetical protein